MNKYNTFYLLIPFLLYATALPINMVPENSIFASATSATSATTAEYTPHDINILSVGDWGSAALGGYHLRNAQSTAYAMKIYASEYNPKLVLNTGDNFYYCGIQNTSDPQVNSDYVELFGNIDLPWYNTLGNHDYGFNPDAQLELNQTIPQWIMDARYYHRRVIFNSSDIQNNTYETSNISIALNVIVLDTNPCVNDYRGDDRAKWDPCSIQYPLCSPVAGECMFHENIINQSCKTQLDWFNTTLSNIPLTEWVFVIGHHKADEIDVEDFQSLLGSNRVNLYLNGHNHNLEHYSIDGDAKYMTTGAGGMVIIGSNGHSNVKLHEESPEFKHRKHGFKSVWSKITTGFSSHTFIDKGTKVVTKFWDVDQNVLYNFTISHTTTS
jgi:tartrate-resistant acid phosphatase type 5